MSCAFEFWSISFKLLSLTFHQYGASTTTSTDGHRWREVKKITVRAGMAELITAMKFGCHNILMDLFHFSQKFFRIEFPCEFPRSCDREIFFRFVQRNADVTLSRWSYSVLVLCSCVLPIGPRRTGTLAWKFIFDISMACLITAVVHAHAVFRFLNQSMSFKSIEAEHSKLI